LSNDELENIDVWTKKPREIAVLILFASCFGFAFCHTFFLIQHCCAWY